MIWRALLGLVVLELIGAAVLTLVLVDLKRWVLAAKLGLSFALGLVTLTLSLFLASLAGARPAWWLGVAEMLGLWVLVVAWRRERLQDWLPPRRRQGTAWDWQLLLSGVLMLFIFSLVAVVSAVGLLEPLVEWDVVAIWAYKGKVLLHEPLSTSNYFHDVTKAYSHLDYPLLWPLTMAWVWACAGEADLQVVKVLGPSLLCALGATFYGLRRRCTECPSALLFTALLLGLPEVLSQTSRLMADAPLSLFLMAAFVCCYLWIKSGHNDDLKLAGFFAAGMLFTKNEGIGLFVILLVVVTVVLAVRRKVEQWKTIGLWLVAVPLMLTLTWFFFRFGIPKMHEDYGGRMNPVYFFQNILRVPDILIGSLRYFNNAEDWLAFWPLLAVLLVVTVKHWVRLPILFLVVAVTMILMMYGYIYVVSPWELKDLMETTANRLLLHATPLCVFLLAELVQTAKLLPSKFS